MAARSISMATKSEVNTVWIGFMDIVPVIGTVKEAVELVVAVYEGNKEVIKAKEKAVEIIVKESSKKHVTKLTLPGKPAADAATASEFSGLKNVREVKREKIIEYMNKGSKRGAKPPQAELSKRERERKVEAIRRDMLEKIHLLNPNYNQELKLELGRSGRGEHVFNNNILRFHSGVLRTFIEAHNINNLQGYEQPMGDGQKTYKQTMDELGRHTLAPGTAEDIQQNMVVHFDPDELYVNANALMYSEYCGALRAAMTDVLRRINPDDVTPEERDRVNYVIDNMNNLQIYVDQLAKEKWINNLQARLDQFERVRVEVVTMYRMARGYDWCIQVLHVVAPLFGYV